MRSNPQPVKKPFNRQPKPIVRHAVFKSNLNQEEIKNIEEDPWITNFISQSSWSINGVSKYSLSSTSAENLFSKIKEATC